MATTQIPRIYDIYFRWGDPLVCALTTVATIFAPEKILEQALPHAWTPGNPVSPMIRSLMWQLSGLFCFIAVIQGGLLRYTRDVNVWKITNAGVLVVDCLMLAGLYEMHAGAPGGFSFAAFRPNDWLNWGITALAVIMRAAFIADVGLGSETTRGSKKRQ